MGAGSAGLTPAGRRFLLAVIVALFGTSIAVAAGAQLKSRDHRTLAHARAGVAATESSRISNLNRRVEQYANVLSRTAHQDIGARLAAAPHTDFAAVGVVAVIGNGETSAARDVSGDAGDRGTLQGVTGLSAVHSAEYIARDTAAPVAVTVGSGAGTSLVVVWPLYSGAPPTSTEPRRANATGWVIGVTPVAAAVGPALSVFRPLDVNTVLTPMAAGPGPVGPVLASAASVRIDKYPTQSRLPVTFIAVMTLLATLLVLFLAFSRRRSDARAAAADRTLREQIRLLSDISMTVQESLDVGLVLPAALTQIAEAHDLTYVAVILGSGDRGGQVLAIGKPPADVPSPRWVQDANHADPGQLIRLPLQRATRTMGYVELVSPHELNATELTSLRSTTDLLANTLHNAELYEREQENVRKLRDLDEMKDDFLATVSHELRTPLSVLVGFMSLLARKWDRLSEADRREAVVKSNAHVTSLAHLVNDLLDFVSERRTRNPLPEELPLQRTVAAIVDQLRPLCERQHLELRLDDEVTAWTDPRAVERIIGNLVSNAAKYAAAGTTITVSAEVVGDAAVVTVADEGPGISPDEQKRIFERFYRGESDAARSTRGSGIGLSVVHEWVRAVGARLEVASEPGRGTSISVYFPRSSDVVVPDVGTVRWLERVSAQRSLST